MDIFGFLLIFIVGHFVIAISSFITFDSLIKLEYFSYRAHWNEDGQPIGFFWIAPENRKFFILPFAQLKHQLARDKLSRKWLFSTPDWINHDLQALRLTNRYRWLILTWTVIFVIPTLTVIMIVILTSLSTVK